MTSQLPHLVRDLIWGEDMDPAGREVTSDLQALAQDIDHVIQQLRGSNMADPHKGCAAGTILSGTLDRLKALPALIDSQLAEVSRVTSSQSSLVQESDGSYTVRVQVQAGSQVINLAFAPGPTGLTRVA